MAFYLHDLASGFHAHWNKGKESPQLRLIRSEVLASPRASLVAGLRAVLGGLKVLGVEAPEEM